MRPAGVVSDGKAWEAGRYMYQKPRADHEADAFIRVRWIVVDKSSLGYVLTGESGRRKHIGPINHRSPGRVSPL